MNNVLAAARQAEVAGLVYATFARHAEVELSPLPENVVVVADQRCGCRESDCYFCGALDEAVWHEAYLAEEQEIAERYGWDLV